MTPPMPTGLEPFDITKHTCFTVCCDAILAPGFWAIDENDVVWLAPDVFKRLKAILREKDQTS